MNGRSIEHDEKQAAVQTEHVFREVNERIEDLNETFETVESMQVVCECADAECIAQIELTKPEYEAVRADPTWFLVLPEHVLTDVERVVDRRDGYVVVEKFAREAARELDPRSD